METTTRAIWKCFYIFIFFETVDILDFFQMAAILFFLNGGNLEKIKMVAYRF